MNNSMIVNRAFFGKDNCLKVTLNKEKDCYFHWGTKDSNGYNWVKVKFNDIELAQMVEVAEGQKPGVSFFHKFNGNQRQIWINKKGEYLFLKVKELSKSLTNGEITILKIILQNCIWKINCNL